MGVTPKIITIKDYILNTVLPRIDASGNYNYAIGTKGKKYVDPSNLRAEEFPAVFILDEGFASFAPLTNEEYVQGRTPANVQDGEIIQLIGYVNAPETADDDLDGVLQDNMDKLISDIIIAWHADGDYRLGGLADHGTALVAKDKGRDRLGEGLGEVLVWFSVKYAFNPSAGIT